MFGKTLLEDANMKRYFVLAFLWLAGCLPTSQVLVAGGSIYNDIGRELSNISIVHHPTEQKVTCNTLLPDSDFALGFDARTLKATSATIEWKDPILGPQYAGVQVPQVKGSDGTF